MITYRSNIAPLDLIRNTCRIAAAIAGCLLSIPTWAQTGTSEPAISNANLDESCKEVVQGKAVPCPDTILFFRSGEGVAQRFFNARKFVDLDKLYQQWCTGAYRFADGSWRLAKFGEGLKKSFNAYEWWGKDLETIRKWQDTNPESTAALYVEALYWRAYAWKARGGDNAYLVSKEAWELFYERLAKAKAALEKLKKSSFQCPAPYPLILDLMVDTGATDAQLRSTYAEAISKFPEYHEIYLSMSRHYEPKWGGSLEKFEKFAGEAVQKTKAFEGNGMYAKIYFRVDRNHGTPFEGEKSTYPQWKKLKASYEDLVRLHPSSVYINGIYASVACRTKDTELYRALRMKIVGFEKYANMFEPLEICDRRHHWPPASQ